MSHAAPSRVTAVLGPTNTGKTHLAVERMMAHSSGLIGFPLRLLAREVYDRVRAAKGDQQVALVTGEERIVPDGARWFCATAEAMPGRGEARPGSDAAGKRDFAFVALDEVQLAADPERGHVFTDRLLHARGREETMLLGSESMKPLVSRLVPEAEIVGRPRFSTLRYAGAKKLSRLPPRSAIVAFSAEQVYAVAEMLRRHRGGAAVVMGALSPRTRNAQVAMFQSGEVDYLVATDAIGMGLNMDVGHIAFASLSKFDGVRHRRLTIPEMAQIAGRAGRHHRDGSFGTLAGTGEAGVFTPEEIEAIEEHRFAPLSRLYWRNARPRFDSLAHLAEDLEMRPPRPEFAPAPEAVDLAVLRLLAADPAIGATVRGQVAVRRFWDLCSLPDFRQSGAERHAAFLARLWPQLHAGTIEAGQVAARIAELDSCSGDIDRLSARLAAIRTWAYVAQRPDWVRERHEMAARARAVEDKLSDALHERLQQRFVDRRTSVLMRRLGADSGLRAVTCDEADVVSVDGEPIGRLDGFRFVVAPETRAEERKLLLAAADRHLPHLLASRASALLSDPDCGFALTGEGMGVLRWRGAEVARLARGRVPLAPRLVPDRSLDRLPPSLRQPVLARLEAVLAGMVDRPLAPLARISACARDPEGSPALRALCARLAEAGGCLPRAGSGLDQVDPAGRRQIQRLGIVIGALDLFVPRLMRPAAQVMLDRLFATGPGHGPAPAGAAPAKLDPVIPLSRGAQLPRCYRSLGSVAIRVDLAERLLRAAHDGRGGRSWFAVSPRLARSVGLPEPAFVRLLREAGFRSAGHGGDVAVTPFWRFEGLRAPRCQSRVAAARGAPAPAHGPFAALGGLLAAHG